LQFFEEQALLMPIPIPITVMPEPLIYLGGQIDPLWFASAPDRNN
jgi:hypothetical protein